MKNKLQKNLSSSYPLLIQNKTIKTLLKKKNYKKYLIWNFNSHFKIKVISNRMNLKKKKVNLRLRNDNDADYIIKKICHSIYSFINSFIHSKGKIYFNETKTIL